MNKFFEQKFDALILLNGEKPNIEFVNFCQAHSKNTIAADGAYDWAETIGMRIDFIVGDMDSTAHYNKNKKEFLKIDEQDTNDLDKCLRFCLSNNWLNTLIIGALGCRADHMLTNIFTLQKYQNILKILLMDEKQILFFCPKDQLINFNVKKNSFFSLYPYKSKCGPIYLKGVEYPLENSFLCSQSKLGTLNRAIDEKIELFCGDDSLMVIIENFLPHEKS